MDVGNLRGYVLQARQNLDIGEDTSRVAEFANLSAMHLSPIASGVVRSVMVEFARVTEALRMAGVAEFDERCKVAEGVLSAAIEGHLGLIKGGTDIPFMVDDEGPTPDPQRLNDGRKEAQ